MIGTVSGLLLIAIVAVYGRNVNEEAKHWAVIVAGSNGWFNYRHQADACHAYQIVRKNGIPEERIITMMYDDIAQNRLNPTPGKIINRPNGPDVYHGVKIDYKGLEVNPENFLKVLRGEKEGMRGIGSGRVLESGPNDHVFVNFVDHGAPGILAFGREFLHATDLHKTIMQMHERKHYAKMVFYVEACESGSIFENDLLPKDINVFATTAANPHESSYACYMDKERKTFLGDVYSVKWMEDSDKEKMHISPPRKNIYSIDLKPLQEDLSAESLTKQFKIVKEETNTSHVQEYGDLTMGSLDVGEFQGKNNENRVSNAARIPNPNIDAVPSEDVELNIALLKEKMATTMAEKEIYREELNQLKLAYEGCSVKMTMQSSCYNYHKPVMRERTRETFKHIVSFSVNHDAIMVNKLMTQRRTLHSHDCYKPVVEYLRTNCSALNIVQNDYGLRHLYTLVNLCELPTPVYTIMEAIEKTADDTDLC